MFMNMVIWCGRLMPLYSNEYEKKVLNDQRISVLFCDQFLGFPDPLLGKKEDFVCLKCRPLLVPQHIGSEKVW